jgi:hypothetical protein
LREASTRLRQGGRIINFSSSVIGLYSRLTPSTPPPRRRSKR